MLSFYRDAMEPFHCFQHGFSFTSCYCLSERSNSQRTQKSVGAFLGVLMRVAGILGIRVLARICQVLASSSVPDTVVYAYNSSNWQRLGPGSEVQGHRKVEVSLLHSHLEKKKGASEKCSSGKPSLQCLGFQTQSLSSQLRRCSSGRVGSLYILQPVFYTHKRWA